MKWNWTDCLSSKVFEDNKLDLSGGSDGPHQASLGIWAVQYGSELGPRHLLYGLICIYMNITDQGYRKSNLHLLFCYDTLFINVLFMFTDGATAAAYCNRRSPWRADMRNVGGQRNVFTGVSGADLFLSVFWQIGELDVGAALRLNDTSASLQPVCIRSTLAPPSLPSFTVVKTYTLQTIAPEDVFSLSRGVFGKNNVHFDFCQSNNRRGRARHNNRPWHYVQSSHSSAAFLGQMKRLARWIGSPQPVTLMRRCFLLPRPRAAHAFHYLFAL